MPHSPPAYPIPLTIPQLADLGSLMLLTEQVRMTIMVSLKPLLGLSYVDWIKLESKPTGQLLEALLRETESFATLTLLAHELAEQFGSGETVRHHLAHSIMGNDADADGLAFFNWRRKPSLTVDAIRPALEAMVSATWAGKAMSIRVAELVLDGVLPTGSPMEPGPWVGVREEAVKF